MRLASVAIGGLGLAKLPCYLAACVRLVIGGG